MASKPKKKCKRKLEFPSDDEAPQTPEQPLLKRHRTLGANEFARLVSPESKTPVQQRSTSVPPDAPLRNGVQLKQEAPTPLKSAIDPMFMKLDAAVEDVREGRTITQCPICDKENIPEFRAHLSSGTCLAYTHGFCFTNKEYYCDKCRVCSLTKFADKSLHLKPEPEYSSVLYFACTEH